MGAGGDLIGPRPQIALRSADTYFAWAGSRGASPEGGPGTEPLDIFSAIFPDTGPTPAPLVFLDDAPPEVNTDDGEGMPAWADGPKLGFVRTSTEDGEPKRELYVYDLTPGIQAITAGPIDLGAAPTEQTRAYQEYWGNLSLAVMEIENQGAEIRFRGTGGFVRYVGGLGFFDRKGFVDLRLDRVTVPSRGGVINSEIVCGLVECGRKASRAGSVTLVIKRVTSLRTVGCLACASRASGKSTR